MFFVPNPQSFGLQAQPASGSEAGPYLLTAESGDLLDQFDDGFSLLLKDG